MVLAGLLSFLMFVLVIMHGYNILVALITTVYPMAQTLKAVQTGEDAATKKWLRFWTVLGIFQTTEKVLGFVFNIIPYFWIVRLGFLLYLMLPQTNGAQVVYEKVIRDAVIKNQDKIEEVIEAAAEKANDIIDSVKAEETTTDQ